MSSNHATSADLPQAVQDVYESFNEQEITTLSAPTKVFLCGFESCKSKPFKRRAELHRHELKHGKKPDFPCMAQGCKRGGNKGFHRKDKLVDHMLHGHDEDTLFKCEEPGCNVELTRDVLPIHVHWGNIYASLKYWRKCPMPRCPFKVFAERKSLDTLQNHLLEKHDVNGRANFAKVIAERGYDFNTCRIKCPICPHDNQFAIHADFYAHFMRHHFDGPVCALDEDASCLKNCGGRNANFRLSRCTSVPDEVREHRRKLLSLWPDFAIYPVWDDLKCRF
ncbi:hypothetical protein P153DRAFT_363116 [Dothidotthia symphoricarpi CBS 119687]|uniref:C2H2-type domain-containing protein n=1 Tax=Dothidotthia symphoricarpi CBS 119687 TaxID=1392245 RepID=A0A6A6AUC5_9PLEO|nr:uncharacterized protein P153DRAFT_363116 [Dothidotthia symphoricarpi CBS 119687]KAF2134131.1 hypothetical protein P153DRAFT_363116 [Dothidotthia symphoricarpi CBS 119687]